VITNIIFFIIEVDKPKKSENIYISFVSAVRDEAGNLPQLHKEITTAAERIGKPWEVIYVENGSKDNTLEVLKSLPHSKTIVMRWNRNIGKTAQSAALDAGVKAAQGEFIATLDADLEDDPSYIPEMLEMIHKEDLDVVAGWRQGRKDPIVKRFITRIARLLRNMFIDDGIHDSGCTLRVYKKECFEDLDLYGEMHRFIGALLKWRGFKIGEMKVKNRQRTYGETKYKMNKAVRGLVDLFNIWFWKKYSDRPVHLFGSAGLFAIGFGVLALIILAGLRLFTGYPLSTSVWPTIASLFILAGMQLFITGLLADQLVKNYYASSDRRAYLIKEVIENK
jgi:glycosyltransferase involved in cell wall biosynthesis